MHNKKIHAHQEITHVINKGQKLNKKDKYATKNSQVERKFNMYTNMIKDFHMQQEIFNTRNFHMH